MNQRKISISNELTQNENNTFKQYDNAIIKLLTIIRITQKHVKIEFNIDCFLINYQFEFFEFKKKILKMIRIFFIFIHIF